MKINNPKLDGPRTWISNFKDQSHGDLIEEGMPSRNSEYWRFSSPKLWESNGDFLNNAESITHDWTEKIDISIEILIIIMVIILRTTILIRQNTNISSV